jgi:hypothetical protein
MLMLLLIDDDEKFKSLTDDLLYFLSHFYPSQKRRQIQMKIPNIQISTRRLFERKQNNIRPFKDRVVVYY